MYQDIYFPIWSNVDFFRDTTKQPELINRIKLSILMYDNIIFDSGIYNMQCSEFGSFSVVYPYDGKYEIPESPIEDVQVTMQEDGSNQAFYVIPPSKGKSFIVCFEYLINKLGLSEEKFIKFQFKELSKYGEEILKDATSKTESYKDLIDGSRFCKNRILTNFHTSLLLARDLNAPIMVDNLHHKMIEKMNITNLKPELKLEVLYRINKLLKHNIPDFSAMEIEELLNLREDKLFKNFRSKLIEINNTLTSKSLRELEELDIESLFMGECIAEMKEFAPSGKEVAINGSLGILGFFPVIGTAASAANLAYTGKQVKDLYDYKNSWMAFVMEYK